ncbi:MAG: hypothetical protein APF76_09525 [Desulfitibacter sp. BRH_c19]|nr:MAG: hypothetical protein APF76_09525 [Desulfitibacter sp. BRH_c19]
MVGVKAEMNNIYLATEDKKLHQLVQKIMARNGYQITERAASAVQVVRDVRQRRFQLAIMDYSLPGFSALDMINIMEIEDIPVVLLVNGWQTNFSELTKAGQVNSIVVKPITENNLIPVVESVLAVAHKIKLLKSEIDTLKMKMEARKTVEKAKGILMKTLSISEDEAFKKIQKQSMNQSMSMKAVAEAIINSYQLFK